MSQSRVFPTEAEAIAFREGVEMVNDSAITDLEVREVHGEGWRVFWFDEDSLDDIDAAAEEGPSERQIEAAMQWTPPRPFTMADKDHPERYRP